MNDKLFLILACSIIALISSGFGLVILVSLANDLSVVWSELEVLKDSNIEMRQFHQSCF